MIVRIIILFCIKFLTVYYIPGHFILGDNQVLGDCLLSLLFVRHVFCTTDRSRDTVPASRRYFQLRLAFEIREE